MGRVTRFGQLSSKTREQKKKCTANGSGPSQDIVENCSIGMPGPSSSWLSHIGEHRRSLDKEECDDLKEIEIKEENDNDSHHDINVEYQESDGEDSRFDRNNLENKLHGGASMTSSFFANKLFLMNPSKVVSKESGSNDAGNHGSYQSCHCIFCFKTFKPSGTCLRAPTGFDADLMVMFVLKKLLEIPRSNLGEYLQLGDHPRDWIFFCEKCNPVILEAFEMQKSVQKLETRLRIVQDDIRKEIRHSFNTTGEDVLTANGKLCTVVTTDVRRYVATANYEGNRTRSSTGLTFPCTKNPTSTSRKRSLAKNIVSTSSDPLSTETQADSPEMPDFNPPTPEAYKNSDYSDENDSSSEVPLQFYSSVEDSVESEERTVQSIHPKETAFRRCALCPKIDPMDSHAFARHVLYHYDRPYKCLECGAFLTGNQKELEKHPKHVKRNSEMDPNHSCSLKSVSKVEYQVAEIWECAYCEEKCNTMEERELHESTVHNQNTLSVKLECKCCSCTKEFRSEAEWRVHRALEHPELAKLSCNYCDETFKLTSKEGIEFLDQEKLRTHLRASHNLNFHRIVASECDFCGASFRTTVLLKRHTEKEHVAIDSSPPVYLFSCPICHARSNIRRNQQLHLLGIHFTPQKKPLICDACGYLAWNIPLFQEHQFMKHGFPPANKRPILKCSTERCSYECILKKSLEVHMIKEHGKERHIKCDICGKRYMRSEHLKRHRQIHENAGMKPFQCEICGNSFALKNYLYIHMRLSHQNRPFASTHKKRPAQTRKTVKQAALHGDRSPATSKDPGTT